MTTSDKTQFNTGVALVTDAIGSTMGPSGRAIMECGGARRVVRDGFTALHMIAPDGVAETEAVLRFRDMARNLVTAAGDGTSTGTLLLGNMYLELEKQIGAGEITRQQALAMIDECESVILKAIQDSVIKPERGDKNFKKIIRSVATISAAGDEAIGKAIADMMLEVGVDSDIRVEAAQGMEVETEILKGFVVNGGVLNAEQYNLRGNLSLDKCGVLVIADEISDYERQINRPYKEFVDKNGPDVPFVIFGLSVDGTAKSTLLNPMIRMPEGNHVRAKIWFVQIPKTETLEDIAAAAGAKVFNPHKGNLYKSFHYSDLGVIDGLTSTIERTTIVTSPSMAESIDNHCLSLAAAAEDVSARVAALRGKVGVIRVPVKTRTMGTFYVELVDDAWRAARSAMEKGAVPGCGYTLAYAAGKLSALQAPIALGLTSIHQQVCQNAGLTPQTFLNTEKHLTFRRKRSVRHTFWVSLTLQRQLKALLNMHWQNSAVGLTLNT